MSGTYKDWEPYKGFVQPAPTEDARNDIEPYMYVAGFTEDRDLPFDQQTPWSKSTAAQKIGAHRKAIDVIRAKFKGPIADKLIAKHQKSIVELMGWPQPKNDWILVRTDPLPEQKGGILLPKKGDVYTATVLATGRGAVIPLDHNKPDEKRFIPTDVKPGERVAFLRWTIESQQGKQVASTFEELGADIALIKERDILFVLELEPGEKVELSL